AVGAGAGDPAVVVGAGAAAGVEAGAAFGAAPDVFPARDAVPEPEHAANPTATAHTITTRPPKAPNCLSSLAFLISSPRRI
ncbi:MAG: hypothetical protein WBR10_12155, partial [Candidatus Acidiferrum sp.]